MSVSLICSKNDSNRKMGALSYSRNDSKKNVRKEPEDSLGRSIVHGDQLSESVNSFHIGKRS